MPLFIYEDVVGGNTMIPMLRLSIFLMPLLVSQIIVNASLTLDEIDLKILRRVLKDARMSYRKMDSQLAIWHLKEDGILLSAKSKRSQFLHVSLSK